MFRVEPVQRQRAYYNYRGVRRYRDFKTTEQAIDKIAWWMIFDKYWEQEKKEKLFTDRLAPKWIPCECLDHPETDEYGRQMDYEWRYCPVHDRDDGYFARLHARLVRYMKSLED